ncbi:MAG TPA: methionyl-tRNA formyltransferase [Chitinophagaceae bacterium]|nr:methionyl-tRNA formyltransferase [Chitinophagaceae bacterium]
MSKFKIGYFADGPWAYNAFRLLIQDATIEICFVCVRYDSTDGTLAALAAAHNIPLLKDANINSTAFCKLVADYKCDLFVSMSFNQIFKEAIMNIPPLKTINCHAGKLPFYRGRNILNWALINDEKEFGITVHFVDNGIDTGDIILQKSYPITDNDDYKTLLEKAYADCATVLYEAISLVKDNNFVRIQQSTIHPVGFYCAQRKPGDEKLNWMQSSRDIFNFIRAICDPGPMARTFLNDTEIKINKARMIENAPVYRGNPGQVVGKVNGSLIVKTMDTTIELVEYFTDAKIKIGDKLK